MKGTSTDVKAGRTERQGNTHGGEKAMARQLSERLLLPVATEADAETTCTAIRPHLGDREVHLIVVHVIEKTPGYPDKAPYGARREQADAIFGIVREHFAGADHRISSKVRYGTNVVEEILATADAVDATAIGFTPRPGRRWTKLIAGDFAHRLITTSRRPIIVFPLPDNDQKDPDELRDSEPDLT